MNSVRTNLSVLETSLFKIFLEQNDMAQVHVGHYADRVNNYQVDNRICYAYSNTYTEVIANMTYMTLKYGSVEQAFVEFKKEIMTQNMSNIY
jgi:hypothetical protein